MKIKAKCSFIARNGISATAGEVLNVSDDQGKQLIEYKLAEAVSEPANGGKAEPAKA